MNQALVTICLFVLVSVVFIIFMKFIAGMIHFTRTLKYINSEIERSHGSERRSWKRKRKRLFKRFFYYLQG